jgi:hypothetical protein
MNLYETTRTAKIGDIVTVDGRKGKIRAFHPAASCAICIAGGKSGCFVADYRVLGINYLPCLHTARADGQGVYIEAVE